jgi:hypothetical protein
LLVPLKQHLLLMPLLQLRLLVKRVPSLLPRLLLPRLLLRRPLLPKNKKHRFLVKTAHLGGPFSLWSTIFA